MDQVREAHGQGLQAFENSRDASRLVLHPLSPEAHNGKAGVPKQEVAGTIRHLSKGSRTFHREIGFEFPLHFCRMGAQGSLQPAPCLPASSLPHDQLGLPAPSVPACFFFQGTHE